MCYRGGAPGASPTLAAVRPTAPPGDRLPASLGPVAVLVPVKSFRRAKLRLAPALDGPERAALARAMAERVLHATGGLPCAVVCDDPEVAAWALAQGAGVVWQPGRGLDRAVQSGVARLGAAGAVQVIVAHADLPLATDVSFTARFAGVTLVPDRREDGTNVACVPVAAGFRFAYGPGSFARHQAEAVRLGLALRIARQAQLAWDVDVPDDLLPAGRR
ncbi:MAG: 2-phospho-L-lactate guanylyltransferase [Actinobacteria bacterium]|nr:MAG: 2-phospho-L-lactate guanylyltransferase [Actinomycetota bacterium]